MTVKRGGSMEDLIERARAIEIIHELQDSQTIDQTADNAYDLVDWAISEIPSAQPTLYGYPVEHLALIARVLQKENFPPERISEILFDVGRIVEMVRDEFEETLRKAVEQCTMT